MDMHFEDKMELDDNGNWTSTTPDSELGKFVYACLWHKYDNMMHYSDRFKRLFKPNWKDKEQERDFMTKYIIDKDNTLKALGSINTLLSQSLQIIKKVNEDEQWDFVQMMFQQGELMMLKD